MLQPKLCLCKLSLGKSRSANMHQAKRCSGDLKALWVQGTRSLNCGQITCKHSKEMEKHKHSLVSICHIRSEPLDSTAGKAGIQSSLSPAPLTAAAYKTSKQVKLMSEQVMRKTFDMSQRQMLSSYQFTCPSHQVFSKTPIKKWEFGCRNMVAGGRMKAASCGLLERVQPCGGIVHLSFKAHEVRREISSYPVTVTYNLKMSF